MALWHQYFKIFELYFKFLSLNSMILSYEQNNSLIKCLSKLEAEQVNCIIKFIMDAAEYSAQ